MSENTQVIRSSRGSVSSAKEWNTETKNISHVLKDLAGSSTMGRQREMQICKNLKLFTNGNVKGRKRTTYVPTKLTSSFCIKTQKGYAVKIDSLPEFVAKFSVPFILEDIRIEELQKYIKIADISYAINQNITASIRERDMKYAHIMADSIVNHIHSFKRDPDDEALDIMRYNAAREANRGYTSDVTVASPDTLIIDYDEGVINE